MQARSALFDVYGDHVQRRGGAAPIAGLVRLLGAVDIAAPAVRTAVSRMVRQDWLTPTPTPQGPGYALTGQAGRRLDEARARIYRTREQTWDGHWHVLVLERPGPRSARTRLDSGLHYLGYAPLSPTTWISPWASAEVEAVVAAEGAVATAFRSTYGGDRADLAARAWDLDAVASAYAGFVAAARAILDTPRPGDPDRAAFATRSTLVHEWRKFLFLDPGLPDEVLPHGWPGRDAAALFDRAAADLLPAADRYVDRCLQVEDEETT